MLLPKGRPLGCSRNGTRHLLDAQWGLCMHPPAAVPPPRCRISMLCRANAKLGPHMGVQATQQQHGPDTLSLEQQQAVPWYNQPHPEQLRDVLKLSPYRFQTLVQQEPSILSYRPATLSITLEALTQALHLNHTTIIRVLEQRPSILCQPHEPVLVLHQLAQLLGRTTEQTAFLLNPYPHLLALEPQQLQDRVQQLCTIMHWTAPHTQQPAATAAVAAAGAPAFVQLLANPLQRTAQQLTALSVALDTSEQTCALMVQHRTVLLDMSPAVVRSRLFLLADAAGISCRHFLEQLQEEQIKCLAGLLLLSPSRLQQQLDSLAAMVQSLTADSTAHAAANASQADASVQASCTQQEQQKKMLVHLLLRLGGPTAVAQPAVMLVALRGIVRTHQPWQGELADSATSDVELAELLTASSESLAQARYILHAGLAEGVSLREVLLCPPARFGELYGAQYTLWLTGRA